MKLTAMTIPRVLAGVLIVANVVMAYRVYTSAQIANAPDAAVTWIVSQHSIDGRQVDRGTHPMAVVLLDAQNERAVGVIRELLSGPTRRPFVLVVVTEIPAAVSGTLKQPSEFVYVVRADIATASTTFNATEMWNQWFLFDPRGRRQAKGDLIHGGLRAALASLVDGAPRFSPETLAAHLRPLDEEGAFQRQHDLAKTTLTSAHSTLFLTRASSGCPSAIALRLAEAASRASSEQRLSVMVSSHWTLEQVRTLRTNFQLTLPIERADERTSRVWSDIVRTYGTGITARFLVTFTPGGIRDVQTDASQMSDTLERLASDN